MKKYNITHPYFKVLVIRKVTVTLESEATILYNFERDEEVVRKRLVITGEQYANWGEEDNYITAVIMQEESITEYSEILPDPVEPDMPEQED